MKQGQAPEPRRKSEPIGETDGEPGGDLDKIDRESADSFPSSDPPATSNPGDGREEGWQEEGHEEPQHEEAQEERPEGREKGRKA